MSFKTANLSRLTQFNSTASSKLIDYYEDCVDQDISNKNNRVPHKTIAPSSIRCKRMTWFRLRGVEPDSSKSTDHVLDFVAGIGSACHEMIQTRLKAHLKEDWIDVSKYIQEMNNDYVYHVEQNRLETLVEIFSPFPIRFAVDGIIKLDGVTYLLEIKSSEFSSFDNLMDIKPQHLDQGICYASILGISNILFLYIDRQYGSIKCYEKIVNKYEIEETKQKFNDLVHLADTHIAPEGLPKGDYWCSSSMCPYHEKCKQYGR